MNCVGAAYVNSQSMRAAISSDSVRRIFPALKSSPQSLKESELDGAGDSVSGGILDDWWDHLSSEKPKEDNLPYLANL